MPKVEDVGDVLKAADNLVAAARKAYPNASRYSLGSVCSNAVAMALADVPETPGKQET